MSDVFTKAKRSEVMSRIRSRGNKGTEVALAKLFRRHKITGWRRHAQLRFTNEESRTGAGGTGKIRTSQFEIRNFKVRPDFVFSKLKLALFVDGCFWHGCPRHGTQPKGNATFWRNKISRNQERDRKVNRTLRKSGWRVLRIWEHELARKHEGRLLNRLHRVLD